MAAQQQESIIKTKPTLPLRATIANAQLHINAKESGDIHVDVFSVMGQKVMSETLNSSNATMSLDKVANGTYLITIRQGARQLNVRWNKK